jgi:signal transduction histidine kinase
MVLESEPFSLAECIESTFDLFAARAAQKRIELLYELAPDAPLSVRGDVTRLRQILVNLVGNAVKFTFAVPIAKNWHVYLFLASLVLTVINRENRKWEIIEFCGSMIFLLIFLNPANREVFEKAEKTAR